MSIPFLPAFRLAIFIIVNMFKTFGSSHYLLNNQHHLSSKFTSLASNSATNRFKIGYSCPPFTPQCWPSKLVIFTTSLYAIASALLCLPQSLFPTLYQHCSCLSWFSTCWPASLKFHPALSQIYRLLHHLQIQSKNSSPSGRGTVVSIVYCR